MKKRSILLFICFCPTVLFAQVTASKIYTDFNGFWESSVPGSPIPDNSHNLLAFQVGSTNYSTGVNDNILTNNGIVFSPHNFTALPIATNPNPSDGTYIGVGKMYGGSGNVSPIPVSLPIAQYLRDGVHGLDIGSAIFNFPVSAEINYQIDGITLSSIGDGVPDLVITQMGQISNVQDHFMFKDDAGNTIGTQYTVDLSTIQSLGLFRWKFYNANVNPPTYNTVVGPNDSNNTRDVRIVTLDWADLGITTANAGLVTRFVQEFSGQSDLSFTAYNAESINLRMPISGTVFNDNNGGVPNGTSYQNATVVLKNSMGNTVSSAITDVNGYYAFNNIIQGNYSINLNVPAGYQVFGNSDGQPSATMNIQVSNTPIQNKDFGIYRLPCVKPGALGTPGNFAKMGILTKKSITVPGWPTNVPNGHVVMDSDSKGFVITQMTTTQRNALVPVVGMMIYNTSLQAVQIYRGNTPGVDTSRLGWSSIIRACNEE
ncbi:SdrD B-like domain-containing protein [Chryseobacterium sp. Leaf394]|uniref:SdrD B-like domain-containing protein n=1 Tax=Chryseobacterium sp. Leaf394 TaxID=1736361 RepID=UPI0006FB971C|nr:SdrD B-like domain-containing protein [Chryseobacterium sp. Leaf394]KQS92099.1 hypothetical protein ASG21_06505 [Chryseobacterium sp. Leaf394]